MRGYYAIIYYMPDHGRRERANIGVLLYVPEVKYFAGIISNNPKRIRKFFGRRHVDKERYRVWRLGILNRIAREKADPRGSFTQYGFNNEYGLVLCRPVKITAAREADYDLNLLRLYGELVEEPPCTPKTT